jgi:hypothetical protein
MADSRYVESERDRCEFGDLRMLRKTIIEPGPGQASSSLLSRATLTNFDAESI